MIINLNIIRKLYMPHILIIQFFNLTKMDLNRHQIKEISESIGQFKN
jgi:hypothetical protein